jgi:hypothetical protein
MGLRVLITNLELWPPSGTVMYVRDLALELQRQGHTPAVFSSPSGSVADRLRAAGVVVSDRLGRLEKPDIIHGHHRVPTLLALKHWPTVPAIHICHDHLSPHDRTPRHERIRRHFGVSRLCVQRLLDEGVPFDRVALLPNFVDTARFSPRPRLPEQPRRALVFSNYANAESHLPAVRAACLEAGLDLEVAGIGIGNVLDAPERVLGSYDIVFAKGKAAIEAMAVGCAVVLCDFAGAGPMVTSAQFDSLQERNFGFEALREPLAPAPNHREIARYDADDATRVRDLIRARAGLEGAVERLVAIYREVLAEYRSEVPSRGSRGLNEWSWREGYLLRLYWAWMSIPRQRREWIARLPGVRRVIDGLRRLM